MDLIDELKQFSIRVKKKKDRIKTEGATKTSLVLPFFQILGYNIFNPNEFISEFTADIGIKKGEKVDYAIIENGKPIILVEVKPCNEKLKKHTSQLFRYFGTTSSKFSILTNGIIYKFYTDLENPNVMDKQPFLEIDILDIKDNDVIELKKFQKSSFDIEKILESASELKYSNQVKQLMSQQLSGPTDSFIRYILGEIYSGIKTQNIIDKFRGIIKKSFNHFVNELMSKRIKVAIEKEEQPTTEEDVITKVDKSKISTTMAELEGFFIVKSLLRDIVSSNKITPKDTKFYFGIILDNKPTKWICRLLLERRQDLLIIPDENKKEIKYKISNLEEIYDYKDKLIEVVKRYLEQKKNKSSQ